MNRAFLRLAGSWLLASWASVYAAQSITLTNGATLVGEIVSEKEGKVVFKDSVLGTLTIDASAVKGRTAASAEPSGSAQVALQPSAPPPVAAAPAPKDPNAPHWTRGLQFNYSFVSGAAPALGIGDNTTVGVNAIIERVTPQNVASFSASYNKSRSKPGPASVDNRTFGFQYDHILSPTLRLISRSTYMVDKPKKMDYRFEELLAVGFTLAKTPKTFFLIAPGLGYSQGKKQFIGTEDQQWGGGFYELLNHNFTPTVSLEQKFFIFQSVNDSDYYVYNGYVGLKGQIAPQLSLTTGFNIVHDNHMPPGVKATAYQIMSGVQVNF